jgi:hypothetical protein
MLEQGFLFVSEQPFASDDPEQLARSSTVRTIVIREAPGYPTPYPVGARGRYVRLVSRTAQDFGIGEIEVRTADEPGR